MKMTVERNKTERREIEKSLQNQTVILWEKN